MNTLPNQTNNTEQISCKPYQDLFIYYLKGRVKSECELQAENFIGNWEEEDFSFLFFSSPASQQVERLLRSQPELALIDSFQMSYEQWHGEPIKPYVHGRFHILPGWMVNSGPIELPDDTIPIILDPGVVFGTGTHPTTRDCLDALELAFYNMTPKTVLDLGTGTGLLALASASLGAERVLAVDLNLLAAQTAQNNVRLNNRENDRLSVRGRAETFIHNPADLLIANIHFDVMRQLIDASTFLNKKAFILSGLMRREAKEVANILARLPVRVLKTWAAEGTWHTFYGKRL